jgi:plasmid stabilization system protein ParE
MTRHTVVWHLDVQDDLAETWLNSLDREAVAKAADEIDRALATDPLEQGGELSEGLRFFLAPPLRVLYAVRQEDRIVEILRVRLI